MYNCINLSPDVLFQKEQIVLLLKIDKEYGDVRVDLIDIVTIR